MILATIKAKYLQARKERSPDVALLSVLISDAQMIGKNNGNRESTDAEVITVLKKMIASTSDTIGFLVTKPKTDIDRIELLRHEAEVLESFLPKQLSEGELAAEIDKLMLAHSVTSMKGMGKVMSELKLLHAGKYDGAQASNIFKDKVK